MEGFLTKAWEHWLGKTLIAIIILFLGCLLGAAFIYNRPIDFWGFKMNTCLDTTTITKHDTSYKLVHDTVRIETYNKSKKFDVKSENQKGGQTAGEITN